MKLAKPQDLYVTLASEILHLQLSHAKACQQLSAYFKNPSTEHPMWVVLVDELDAILNKRQDVLYNIFDWPSSPRSRLVVVGIANTMDLTERFMHKISSRIGSERIVFTPYTRDCLQVMIRKRLEHTQVFSKDAINFACAKVANYSGDARRAFHVCRRAIYLSQTEGEEGVMLKQIQLAFDQLFSSANSRAISKLPKYVKLFLVTCCLESKVANTEYVAIHNLSSRYNTVLVNKLQEEMLKPAAFNELAQRLASLNLLSFEQRKLKLRVEVDEVCRALEKDELFALLADSF